MSLSRIPSCRYGVSQGSSSTQFSPLRRTTYANHPACPPVGGPPIVVHVPHLGVGPLGRGGFHEAREARRDRSELSARHRIGGWRTLEGLTGPRVALESSFVSTRGPGHDRGLDVLRRDQQSNTRRTVVPRPGFEWTSRCAEIDAARSFIN
jgi:hypothetical protein